MRVAFGAISKRARWILNATVPLAVLNFLVYGLASQNLGGNASNGMIRDGHYFLCAHGSCTEVTRSVWQYSHWHGIAAFGGLFLVFLEMGIFLTTGDIAIDLEKST